MKILGVMQQNANLWNLSVGITSNLDDTLRTVTQLAQILVLSQWKLTRQCPIAIRIALPNTLGQ